MQVKQKSLSSIVVRPYGALPLFVFEPLFEQSFTSRLSASHTCTLTRSTAWMNGPSVTGRLCHPSSDNRLNELHSLCILPTSTFNDTLPMVGHVPTENKLSARKIYKALLGHFYCERPYSVRSATFTGSTEVMPQQCVGACGDRAVVVLLQMDSSC